MCRRYTCTSARYRKTRSRTRAAPASGSELSSCYSSSHRTTTKRGTAAAWARRRSGSLGYLPRNGNARRLDGDTRASWTGPTAPDAANVPGRSRPARWRWLRAAPVRPPSGIRPASSAACAGSCSSTWYTFGGTAGYTAAGITRKRWNRGAAPATRSYLPTNAPRRRGGRGIWGTSRASSAIAR